MISENNDLEGEETEVERRGSYWEKQLSRMFFRYGVRYFYEHPLAVVDEGRVRIWYPDFWLPDYGLAVEYLGVTHSDAYSACVERKKHVYAASGIPCLYIEPADLAGAWPKRILNRIAQALDERRVHLDELLSRLHCLKE